MAPKAASLTPRLLRLMKHMSVLTHLGIYTSSSVLGEDRRKPQGHADHALAYRDLGAGVWSAAGAPSHVAKGRADAMLSGLCPLHGKRNQAGRWPWARKCPRPMCPVFLFWRRSCCPGAAPTPCAPEVVLGLRSTPCAPRRGQLPVLSQQDPLCSPSTAIGPTPC